jgi:DNA mismatch repair protein MutS
MELKELERLPATPMWSQYSAIKREALDSLLFYRMGDFYELFLSDAETASSILGITLTARNKGDEKDPIPMCGLPFHSSANYIQKLLSSGQRVALCEQIESASGSKGLVKRAITRIVSPGMVLDPDQIEASDANFLLALPWPPKQNGKPSGYGALDISTGRFLYGEFGDDGELLDQLAWLKPKEILLPAEARGDGALIPWLKNLSLSNAILTFVPNFFFDAPTGHRELTQFFGVLNLDAYGLDELHPALPSVGACLKQARETQKGAALTHILPPEAPKNGQWLLMDESTIHHLDLFPQPGRSPEESLFFHLDRTATAMGARQLRDWLQRPLVEIEAINERLDGVEELAKEEGLRRWLAETLKGIRDLERLMGKMSLGTAVPRDFGALREIFQRIPLIQSRIAQNSKSIILSDLARKITPFPDLSAMLSSRLREELPAHSREGGIFSKGWNSALDELHQLTEEAQETLAKMEAREKEATGIQSLKVRFNRVFGYYIEVTAANLSLVPTHYVRKQTTANGERYVTEELKKFEERTLTASDKRIALEQELLSNLTKDLLASSKEILSCARAMAQLDAIQSLAVVAGRRGMVRPELFSDRRLFIGQGRHPVLENLLGRERFVPNSIDFSEGKNFFLLTGPNMGGKSTFMRQVALITLLAQTGSFVPAALAQIGVVDRIATRVGANDRIGRGQSTFMVEMNEMARIIHQATNRSLLLVDEIGRGTSTFDGMALAWAIAEELISPIGARTVFATHYHELTELAELHSTAANLAVTIHEKEGELTFLHEVKPGTASGSYGLEVARLAGMPLPLVKRAEQLLHGFTKSPLAAEISSEDLAKKASSSPEKPRVKLQRENPPLSKEQLTFADVFSDRPLNPFSSSHFASLAEEVRATDPDQTTPLEALQKVVRWRDALLHDLPHGSGPV